MIKLTHLILAVSLALLSGLALALAMAMATPANSHAAADDRRPAMPLEAPAALEMTATILVHDFVPRPTERVALLTAHGLYITATDGSGGWLLKQESPAPPSGDGPDCRWFWLHRIDANGGRVALETCHGRYVTAAITGTTDLDWALRQEVALGKCGEFTVHHQDDGKVAFETCAGKYFTAGDGSWAPPLDWAVIARTAEIGGWEEFGLTLDYWFNNRLGGDGGPMCPSPPSVTIDWSVGVITSTINAGTSDCAGVWTSLNHPNFGRTPIDFSAIFPRQIKPEYQGQITGLRVHTRGGHGTLRVDLKAAPPPSSEIEPVVWSGKAPLSAAAQSISFSLPPTLTEVLNINVALDDGKAGDHFALDRIELTAAAPYTDTAHRAFLWSYAQLLASWDPESGLIRDQAYSAANTYDNTSADGWLAASTVMAWRLGYISKGSASEIVSRTTEALLALPRCHGLWPHFTQKASGGGMEIYPGTEWSSIDTTIAAVALIEAREALGLGATETRSLEQTLRDVDWPGLLSGGSISHGYTGSCGDPQRLPYVWSPFGLESWMVNFGYAAATGKVAEFDHTPPTWNGGGFIDELAWLLMPPLYRDRWGTAWRAYSQEAASRQLAYYRSNGCSGAAAQCPPGAKEGCSCCRANVCYSQAGLFGLTPAEAPDLSVFPPDAKVHYLDFGICGEASCIDGTDPVTIPARGGSYVTVTVGHPVIVPHYAGLVAVLRPAQAIAMWNWLEAQPGLITPLNNAETLMFADEAAPAGGATCSHIVWNARKGAWELGLQTLGWGRYLAGNDNPLYDGFRANDFLERGYLVMGPQLYLPCILQK